MLQQRFIPRLLMAFIAAVPLIVLNTQAEGKAVDTAGQLPEEQSEKREEQRGEQPATKEEQQYPGWDAQSRLQADQWVGNWLISRDGEAQHVWSLNRDGTGHSYAFLERGGKMKFAYGYDIRWYFDPFTQMANIKTERRKVCRGGRVYPYFLTLKSYESDYAVKGKYAWQTTWTEASIGRNYLHKSLVVFIAPLSGWHNPNKGAPCPQFPRMDIEKDIDTALDRWQRESESHEQLVDTTPVEGEPEFNGEEFGPAVAEPKGKPPQKSGNSAKARVRDTSVESATPKKPKRN